MRPAGRRLRSSALQKLRRHGPPGEYTCPSLKKKRTADDLIAAHTAIKQRGGGAGAPQPDPARATPNRYQGGGDGQGQWRGGPANRSAAAKPENEQDEMAGSAKLIAPTVPTRHHDMPLVCQGQDDFSDDDRRRAL